MRVNGMQDREPDKGDRHGASDRDQQVAEAAHVCMCLVAGQIGFALIPAQLLPEPFVLRVDWEKFSEGRIGISFGGGEEDD